MTRRRRSHRPPRRELPALLAGLLAAGSGGGSASGPASAPPAPAWLQVASDSDAGLELVLRAPDAERHGMVVRVPGFAAGGEPGLPVLYEQAALLGVPGPAGATLEVLAEVRHELERVVPERVPESRSREHAAGENLGAGERSPAAAPPFAGVYPGAAVRLGPVARVRGRNAVRLSFLPLQYRPDGSASLVSEVRVRIVFLDRPQLQPQPVAEPLHRLLVNHDTAARWELDFETPGGHREHAPVGKSAGEVLPTRRVRLRILERGVYALSYADLHAAGLPLQDPSFDPRTVRLYFDGWRPLTLLADSVPASWQSDYAPRESALWFDDQDGNGSFDSVDRLVFYALGPQGWEDLAGTSGDSLRYSRHPFDAANYGWLGWGDGGYGLRMTSLAATPASSSADSFVSRAWCRRHFEQNTHFDLVDDLWYWNDIRAYRPLTESFALDLGGDATATATLRVALAWGGSTQEHFITVRGPGGERLGSAHFYAGGPMPEPRWFRFPGAVLSSSGSLRFEVQLDSLRTTNSGTELIAFDVSWQRPLAAPASGPLEWSVWPEAAEQYELAGFGSQEPWLLDVSDPARPVRLTGLVANGAGDSTRWRARYAGEPGRRTHFLAIAEPHSWMPGDIEARNVAPLRSRTTSPDMLVVTHESLRPTAERLAEHRRRHFPDGGAPDILVVSTRDIYDEFSGGHLDPMAIRNYVKFLYELPPRPPRLRYLLLFGNGTNDPSRLLSTSAETLVPAVQPWYSDPRIAREYAVDDWLAEMDRPGRPTDPFRGLSPLPDVAVGRLPARSPAEAERLVDKIIAYEIRSPHGRWRTRVIMAADDECHGSSYCGEAFHIGNSEEVLQQVPPEMDVDKLYLTDYPLVAGQKPAARAAFIAQWNAGVALVNYTGHGAPRQLADEVLFLGSDASLLTNGDELPLFVAASCEVSPFDDPLRRSMCEDLLLNPGGGAIATIGATTPTYAWSNTPFNANLLRALFPLSVASHVPLGIVHLLAKQASPAALGPYEESYVLLGDPSMSMRLPRAEARLVPASSDIQTGRHTRVDGTVHAPGDSSVMAGFDGQAEVVVFESADTTGYTSPADSRLHIDYDRPGAAVYRGTVPVVGGRFSFQFILPAGVRLGSRGRVGVCAVGAGSMAGEDAKGGRSDLHLVPGAVADSSIAPPRITLQFERNRTRVETGTPLIATVADENGIDIQGGSPAHSILLGFDHLPQPLDVTPSFRYLAGSDSLGSVTLPLPDDLQPGPHSATLVACDNLHNSGSASLDFEVISATDVRLLNVLAFPNPFRDTTHFFFEMTDPAEVELRVFTTSGRPVWEHHEHVEASQVSILWPGVDGHGDAIGNGTYLYRLRVKPTSGAKSFQYIGKVVVMR